MKDDNVITPDFPTTLPLPPHRVLQGGMDMLSEVVVLGWERGEARLYFAASDPDLSRALMLLELAKQELLSRVEH